jgi:hypothetical protein
VLTLESVIGQSQVEPGNRTTIHFIGCLGFHGAPYEQEGIRHVFLTHSHVDHSASLPIFIENAWTPAGELPSDLRQVGDFWMPYKRHIFNDVMWPDFVFLSKKMYPFLRLCPLDAELPVEAGGLRITPVRLNHVVPTFGFVITDDQNAVIVAGDTGPTERLWEVAHQTSGLRAVFLEACFPNSLKRLAEASLHLTLRRETGAVHDFSRRRRILVGQRARAGSVRRSHCQA